jgi:hypothetical protein
MEFWEFLIQKEGNRSWLPLESPSVEILAGRYRVVARSSRANLAAEVRVTHYAVAEKPPVRRIRKRSSQTNADGLIVILPFTRLQPGVWELCCTGDLMAEMMGENWRYAVQLEVVAETVAALSPSEPGISTAVTAAEATERDLPLTAVPASLTSADPPVAAVDQADQLETPAEPPPETLPELSPQPPQPVEQSIDHLAEAPAASDLPEELPKDLPKSEAGANPEFEDSAAPTQPHFHSPAPNLAEVLQQIERHSEAVVNSAFQELANLEDLPEDLPENQTAERLAASPLESRQPIPQLQVVLEQETYIIQRGEVVALAGKIEYLSDATIHPATRQTLTVSELRVRLYDPQTSAMLMDEVYPIDNRVPPFPFSGTVSLPEHYQTYLVLGELIFQGSIAGGSLQVLARQDFNVTTDLHELIESIANDFPDVEALPPEAQIPVIAEPLPAAELERLSAQPKFQRSPQNQLPPQLRQPDLTRTHASLELPTFVKPGQPNDRLRVASPPNPPTNQLAPTEADRRTPSSKESLSEEISTSAADLAPLTVSLSPSSSSAEAATLPDLSIVSAPEPAAELISPDTAASDRDESTDLFPDWDEIQGRVPIWKRQPRRPVHLSNAPEDVSFRALNLQDRFWTRLQSLATNPELSATLGMEAAELAVGSNRATVPVGQETEAMRNRQTAGRDADLTTHEIVVDDDPLPSAPQATVDEPAGSEDVSLSPVLPEDEPIPVPRLQLPTGELTADQPIQLTVKLPNLLARVYVKLWLRDRQTRELLGTPRWIVDFVPDGFGNQMARTEIVVPPGCLKVQFEAIAVEIATQRESDKTTMTRPVVPPDLSPLSLDRLEI